MRKRVFLLALVLFSLAVSALSNNEIYRRNGNLYVMVGDGVNKGVYGPFRESTEVVVVSSGQGKKAKYLFSPGAFGKAIGADLFGNVYCLCADNEGKFGAPKLSVKDINRLQGEGYPNMGDLQAGNFFRIGMGKNKRPIYANYTGAGGNAGGQVVGGSTWVAHFGHGYQAAAHGNGQRWPASGVGDFAKVYSWGNTWWKDSDQRVVIPNGFGLDCSVQGILPNGRPTFMQSQSHYGFSHFSWIKDYVERNVTFWDSYYHDPRNIITDAGSWDVINDKFTGFEKVFKLLQNTYKYQCEGSACSDSPPGENYGAQAMPSTGIGAMCICVTCTGHRYFYTDTPDPTLKVGLMETDPAQGAVMDPVNPNLLAYSPPKPMAEDGTAEALGNALLLTSGNQLNPGVDPDNGNYAKRTRSVGAATRNRTSDWIYLSDAIDMSVSDQWDGHGGIVYELMDEGDQTKPGTIKITTMEGNPAAAGYNQTVAGKISHTVKKPGKIEAIAGDGIGNLYFMMKNEEKHPGGWNPNTAPADVITEVAVFQGNVSPTGDPLPPGVTHSWTAVLGDGWFGNVYRIKDNDLTDERLIFKVFLGGNVYHRQEFGTYINGVANAVMAAPAVLDAQSSVDVREIDVDLAVVNIAGPPIADDDIAHIDIIGPAGCDIEKAKPDDDYIEEDKWYEFSVENPPSFRGDILNKNDNYGEGMLKTRPTNNRNGFTGGYTISLVEKSKDARIGLVYYFRVIDNQTGKTLYEWWMPNGTSKQIPAQVNNGKPANILVNADSNKLEANVISELDDYIYGTFAKPDIEKRGFSLMFKDPGVYRIQSMAVYLRYNYEEMPFPSFMDERIELGYFYCTSIKCTLNGDWRNPACKVQPGWRPENGPPKMWKDFNTDMTSRQFIAERTVHVKHREAQKGEFITHIKIKDENSDKFGDGFGFTIREDIPNKIHATFYVQWAKYLQFYQGLNQGGTTPNINQHQNDTPSTWLDEYRGVGVWNYPGDNQLPQNAKPGAADANVQGSCLKGKPGDAVAGGKDLNQDGVMTIEDYPYNGFDIPTENKRKVGNLDCGKYGTLTLDPGAGNNHLSADDWKHVKFHWYIGARIFDSGTNSYRWFQTEVAKGDLSDRNFVVSIENVDSMKTGDKMPNEDIPGDFSRRCIYRVDLKIKPENDFKFVMPLDNKLDSLSKDYYVWVEFDYPTLEWEPRDKHPQTGIPSYFDLVIGTESAMNSYQNLQLADPPESGKYQNAYKVNVIDTEGPALYYAKDFYEKLQGASTGDIFPRNLVYLIADNNPNNLLTPDKFKLRLQQENPSGTKGNGILSNDPDRTSRGVYTEYPNGFNTARMPSEGTKLDCEGMVYDPRGSDDCDLSGGNGDAQDDYDRLLRPPHDDSSYYHNNGQAMAPLRHMHRFMHLIVPKHTVGPMPENYDSTIYWFVHGEDETGNDMNRDASGTWQIPPETASEVNAPWKYAARMDVVDNDPPELSFIVQVPKLGRTMIYQIGDDNRDDLFKTPEFGFNDENTPAGAEITQAVRPAQTALVDTVVWDENAGKLFTLDESNGTERGKVRVWVVGDAAKGEPQLAESPISIHDYFMDVNLYGLNTSDLPGGGNSAMFMDGEYFDFGNYINKKDTNMQHVLGIDEDMRVMFEVRSRDNVDFIGTHKESHNMMQKGSGKFPSPKTFSELVIEITSNFTPEIDWSDRPAENINISNISGDNLDHAVHFYQFRESTQDKGILTNVETLKIKVSDAAGNIRAFKLPFRIVDTSLIDELLKRQKEQIKYMQQFREGGN